MKGTSMQLILWRSCCVLCVISSTVLAQTSQPGPASAKQALNRVSGMGRLGEPMPRSPYVPTLNLLLGTVHKGSAFAVEKYFGKNAGYRRPILLHQAPFPLGPGNREQTQSYEFNQDSLTCSPYRWRFSQGCFWGMGSLPGDEALSLRRMPLADLPLFDKGNKDRVAQYRSRYPKTAYDTYAQEWGLGPLGDATWERLRRERRQPPPGRAMPHNAPPVPAYGLYGDVVPTASTKVDLFFCEDNVMRVWRGSAERDDDYYHRWKTRWADAEEEKFAVPFREPFMTYIRDRDFWFVTESGKLYKAPAGDKRKVEVMWDEEASPIRALITDADTDRTFAFTEPAEGTKASPLYFEVGVKPVPKPYERRNPKDFKVPKPLDALLSYVDVLVTDKAITLPAPKPLKPEPKK